MVISEEEIEHLIDLYYYFRWKESPKRHRIRDLISETIAPGSMTGQSSPPLFNLKPSEDGGCLIRSKRISPKYVLETYAKGFTYLIRRTI